MSWSGLFRKVMLVAAFCLPPMLNAAEVSRSLPVSLEDTSGQRVTIATLTLTPVPDGWTYRLDLNNARFADRFLSMRPFLCLEDPVYSLCYLPYPYALERKITRTNLVDLEYELLFIQRRTTEYGISARSGIYYRLTWNGDRIEGRLHEVDLDILAVPPEAGVKRPIGAQDIYEAQGGRHVWPKLVIGQ